jgi:hypothetical protein
MKDLFNMNISLIFFFFIVSWTSYECVAQTMLQSLQRAGNYTTLLSMLSSTGLDKQLSEASNSNNLTLFAPSDQAFSGLPNILIEALKQPAVAPLTRSLLQYHVSPQRIFVAQLTPNTETTVPTSLTGFNLLLFKNSCKIVLLMLSFIRFQLCSFIHEKLYYTFALGYIHFILLLLLICFSIDPLSIVFFHFLTM